MGYDADFKGDVMWERLQVRWGLSLCARRDLQDLKGKGAVLERTMFGRGCSAEEESRGRGGVRGLVGHGRGLPLLDDDRGLAGLLGVSLTRLCCSRSVFWAVMRDRMIAFTSSKGVPPMTEFPCRWVRWSRRPSLPFCSCGRMILCVLDPALRAARVSVLSGTGGRFEGLITHIGIRGA